jgi:hypothetical protein
MNHQGSCGRNLGYRIFGANTGRFFPLHPLALTAAAVFLLLLLQGAQGQSSPQIITGSTIEGNLEIAANIDGSMRIRRYANGIVSSSTPGFKDLTAISPALRNGSFIFTTDGICGLGSFGVNNQTPISNTLVGDTITTIIDCTTTGTVLRFIQEVEYVDNTELLRYKWTVTNTGANTASDFRFTHGHDPVLGAAINAGQTELAKGLYDPLSNAINLYQVHSFNSPPPSGPTLTALESVTLKSDVPPTNFSVFDSFSSTPFDLFSIEPNPTLDNNIATGSNLAYALEWRRTALLPGESFVVEAAERVTLRPSGGNLFISSPVTGNATAGMPIALNFRASNILGSPINITNAAVTTSTTGWTVVVAPASGVFPIPLSTGGASADFTVTVTPPSTAILDDDSGVLIQLFTDDGADFYDQDADVIVNAIPPTPTPTSTPTSTPTATPTSTSTATATPTATPTPTTTATPTSPLLPTSTATPVPPQIPVTLLAPLKSSLQRQPLISGRSFPSAVIRVVLDGTALPPTTADQTGRWSVPSTSVLEIGRHTLNVSAVDPLGRPSALPGETSFIITEGAPLDFDGDGLTDVSRYSTLGNTVAFRSQRSSDGAALNTSVTGAVPAPGSYSGSGVWDFGAISRGATALTWRVRSTATGQTSAEDFGVIGDQPITGCSFVSPKRTSLAVIRGKQKILAKDLGGASIETGVLTSGTIIACIDDDEDGIDELVTVENLRGERDVKISIVKLDGSQSSPGDNTRPFDRGFAIPKIVGKAPGFAFVRIASSSSRVAEIIVPEGDDGASKSISLPRKLVLSSGLFLRPDGSPQTELVYQNITKGTLFKVPPSESATPETLGKIASRSFLLIPQYIYKTKR